VQTLTSTHAPFIRTDSPTRAPGWSVIAVVVAFAATIVLVAALSVRWATSDSSTTPTRTVQSTTAAALTVAPAGPAPAIVRSTNAAEQHL